MTRVGQVKKPPVKDDRYITHEDMVKARLNIYAKHPYFSAALSRMTLIADEKIPISAIDARWNMRYNPKISSGIDKVLDCEAMLYHELFHLLGEHFKRGEVLKKKIDKDPAPHHDFNPMVWNLAGDYEMYATMAEVAAGSRLFRDQSMAPPVSLPETYLAEDYYDYLMRTAQEVTVTCTHQQDQENSQGEGEGEGSGNADGSSGKEKGDKDSSGGGGGQDLSDALKETRDAIERAFPGAKGNIGNGKNPGTDHNEFVRLPVILSSFRNRGWVSRIRSEITEHMRYRIVGFSRPARRQSPDPKMIMMGKRLHDPHITFLVDVSGSIDEAAANEAFAVIDSLRGYNIRFRIFACDTYAKEIKPGEPVYSGGGTDLQEGLRVISQVAPETELCVVISDGETYWDDQPPRFPTVMFTWEQRGPHWMKTVKMPALIGEVG